MNHLVKRLAASVTRTQRRRRRPMTGWNCEAVEARVVLSAVTMVVDVDIISAAELDSMVDDIAGRSDFQPEFRSEMTEAVPVGMPPEMMSRSDRFSPQTEGLSASKAVPGSNGESHTASDPIGIPREGNSIEFRFSSHEGSPGPGPDFNLPIHGTAQTALRPPYNPAFAPQSVVTSTDDTTDSEEPAATQFVAQLSDELTVDGQPQNEASADPFWQNSSNGFVEVARPASESRLRSLGLQILEQQSEVTETEGPRGKDFSDRRLLDVRDESESDEATAAAIAFFNQQTSGGFVDSAIDDLYGHADPPSAIASLGSTGLEGSVGRLNPFDDGRHQVMLTSVHARENLHTGQESDRAVTPDIAMAGLAFGIVGARTGAFSRLLKTVQHLTNQLATVLRGIRTW